MFNADPQPGNYLFHDDGSVSFLDFGCVKRFEPRAGRMAGGDRARMHARRRARDLAGVRGGRVLAILGPRDPRGGVSPSGVSSWELWWAEQPFTVTPEYAARWIEHKYSPTGPSANALRHFTAAARVHGDGPGSSWRCPRCWPSCTPPTTGGRCRRVLRGRRPDHRDGQARPRVLRRAPDGGRAGEAGSLGRSAPILRSGRAGWCPRRPASRASRSA